MKKPFNLFLICIMVLCFFPTVVSASSEVVTKRGMNEERVGQIQAMLWEMKLYDGVIDQDFGPMTEQAVKSFQRKINKPQDGIVTKELEAALAKESGLDFSKIKHKLFVDATAYSSQDPGCDGTTATGTPLRKGIIAVDPSFIPLGTMVYIPGYGKALAADIGGSIKGNVIDIAFDNRSEALQFGCRSLLIYIM
ncbi:MAG: hypothetical protein EOL98_09315 [Negativicutes bacterium]|nr:hypothetical protein [Negativicutes bacterium]